MIYAFVTCFLLATPTPPTAQAAQVEWRRANIGHATVVTSPAVNPHARQASEELQRIADRLDALRTIVPHVIWRRLTWTPRIIQVEAYGDAAIMANVAILALRDLLPGWRSAGSCPLTPSPTSAPSKVL
mgnify:CR=1 FL=1